MRQVVLSLIVFLVSHLSQAGWIIGSDSLSSGVLKVQKNNKTGLIIISQCEYKGSQCKELVQREESILDELVDYAQIGGSFFIQAGPTAILAIASAGDLLLSFAILDGMMYAAAASGYLYLITNVKSLNLIRLYDYSEIQSESFLTDSDETITFPDDSMEEILSEIL